jgi:F-type H+-transporting ATPase subunit delta
MASVASVYAQALVELAAERGKTDAIVADCRELAALLASRPEAFADLASGRVPKAQAKQVLGQVLAGQLQAETLDLIRLLIDRNRLDQVAPIARETVARAELAAGVVHVTATTAAPLDAGAQERLAAGLKRALGPGVVVHPESDPSLIGGVTLRVDDLYVDGSVRRQLAELKSLILTAPATAALWSD